MAPAVVSLRTNVQISRAHVPSARPALQESHPNTANSRASTSILTFVLLVELECAKTVLLKDVVCTSAVESKHVGMHCRGAVVARIVLAAPIVAVPLAANAALSAPTIDLRKPITSKKVRRRHGAMPTRTSGHSASGGGVLVQRTATSPTHLWRHLEDGTSAKSARGLHANPASPQQVRARSCSRNMCASQQTIGPLCIRSFARK